MRNIKVGEIYTSNYGGTFQVDSVVAGSFYAKILEWPSLQGHGLSEAYRRGHALAICSDTMRHPFSDVVLCEAGTPSNSVLASDVAYWKGRATRAEENLQREQVARLAVQDELAVTDETVEVLEQLLEKVAKDSKAKDALIAMLKLSVPVHPRVAPVNPWRIGDLPEGIRPYVSMLGSDIQCATNQRHFGAH